MRSANFTRKAILCMVPAFSLLVSCSKSKPLTFADLDRNLNIESLCQTPVSGDLAKASSSITQKNQKSALFTDLPQDQGALETCSPGSFQFNGNQVTREMNLQYKRSWLTVSLLYYVDAENSTALLDSIKIGSPQALAAGQELPPDQEARRMGAFVDKLDKQAAAKSSAAPR